MRCALPLLCASAALCTSSPRAHLFQDILFPCPFTSRHFVFGVLIRHLLLLVFMPDLSMPSRELGIVHCRSGTGPAIAGRAAACCVLNATATESVGLNKVVSPVS